MVSVDGIVCVVNRRVDGCCEFGWDHFNVVNSGRVIIKYGHEMILIFNSTFQEAQRRFFNAHFVKYSIQISIALFLGVACVLYEYYISIINY